MDASTHLYELWSAFCFIVIASATDIPKSWLYCGIKVHVIIIIIGLHQSADIWPVGTDIAWSVCLLETAVCAVLKWLDHSRCCFWCGLWWARGTEIHQGNEQFWRASPGHLWSIGNILRQPKLLLSGSSDAASCCQYCNSSLSLLLFCLSLFCLRRAIWRRCNSFVVVGWVAR